MRELPWFCFAVAIPLAVWIIIEWPILFKVFKRDYDWRFGLLDYENTMATLNFNYRNYGTIPFDMRVSAGEYLAGDVGFTLEFSM